MRRTIQQNRFIGIFLFCCISTASFSQTLKEAFGNNESPIVYLGIDFSKCKLLDDGNPSEIRDNYYVSINDLIIVEAKKFDLSGAFQKNNIEHDLSAVKKNNAKANLDEIISTDKKDFNRFKESDIAAMVNDLDLSGKQGIGFVFVMEAMRKIEKNSSAAIWVTFIDMKSKKVLMTERVDSKVIGGFGFRNYWASTIKNLIDNIEKKKYKEWKSKYSN